MSEQPEFADEGWIKLYRKLRHHPRKRDPFWIAVWVDMLLQATHQPYSVVWNGVTITLNPGQFITGRISLSQNCGVPENVVRRILDNLETDQQIHQQKSNRSTLVTILNWSDYQQNHQPNNQQTTSRPPADHQQTTSRPPLTRTEEQEEHKKTPPVVPQGGPDGNAQIQLMAVPPVPPPPTEQEKQEAALKIRLGALYGRRPGTQFDPKEEKAFQKLKIIGAFTDDNLKLLEGSFKACYCRRKTLGVLLNNFNGELDLARDFYRNSKAYENNGRTNGERTNPRLAAGMDPGLYTSENLARINGPPPSPEKIAAMRAPGELPNIR